MHRFPLMCPPRSWWQLDDQVALMSPTDLTSVLPELALAIFASGALIWAVYTRYDRASTALIWLTGIVLVGLGMWIGLATTGESRAFNGTFVDDAFSRFAKVVILVSAAIVLIASKDFLFRERFLSYEYPVLVAFAVVGMMVMVSANDLIVMYMGIEMQSLSLYVLAAFNRDNSRSTEAGLKYFVLGALSSGILLYGASLVYGYTGTTLYEGIALASAAEETRVGLLFGLAFIIVGIAFKVSAAPFHMWAPDVYEGAPTPVTALLATAPKIAAMFLFARLLMVATGSSVSDWQLIIAGIAVISMFLGSIAAIRQTNIKRLMAYSSISHMGYALIGLAAGTSQGLEAMLVYLVIYTVMNVGTFAFIMSMRRDGRPVTSIYSLSMLSRQAPLTAFCMLLLLFSLAGIVPMVGFFAKLYVFAAAVEAGFVWLAIAGGIASVIGAYYYLRLVYFMYFGQAGEILDRNIPRVGMLTLAVSALVMIVGVVNLFGIPELSHIAVGVLLQ